MLLDPRRHVAGADVGADIDLLAGCGGPLDLIPDTSPPTEGV